ncbi:MAG: hypothetical protein MR209_00615 [Veillonellaceae bacterium]|nr:hypothetical protein [Veillonellaceae bacterium]
MAEGRGKAQADSLRKAKKDLPARVIPSPDRREEAELLSSSALRKDMYVLVEAGETIPADGEIVEGAASVDESAVTGGTTLRSDYLIIRITNNPGDSFLDKMIAMIDGAERQKTPNELALQIFLISLSIIFLLVTMSLYSFADFSARDLGTANPLTLITLLALLVCLAPTTIGALLSAIGIAGMSRLNRANVVCLSGRAMSICCCWIRPARSPWAIGRPRNSCRFPA